MFLEKLENLNMKHFIVSLLNIDSFLLFEIFLKMEEYKVYKRLYDFKNAVFLYHKNGKMLIIAEYIFKTTAMKQ